MELLRKLGPPILILSLASATQGAQSGMAPIDRIAAVVENSVITYSELLWFIRYRGFQMPEDEQERARFSLVVLDQLINQKLIARETVRTPFVSVSEAQLEAFLEQYRQRFRPESGFEERLQEIGIGLTDFKELLRSQLLVNRFVELRFEPFIIVLPDEIEEYYRTELIPNLEESGQPLPELNLVEETIRQLLSVRKTTAELERWVENTRATTEIQILLGREPPDSPNLPGLADGAGISP